MGLGDPEELEELEEREELEEPEWLEADDELEPLEEPELEPELVLDVELERDLKKPGAQCHIGMPQRILKRLLSQQCHGLQGMDKKLKGKISDLLLLLPVEALRRLRPFSLPLSLSPSLGAVFSFARSFALSSERSLRLVGDGALGKGKRFPVLKSILNNNTAIKYILQLP